MSSLNASPSRADLPILSPPSQNLSITSNPPSPSSSKRPSKLKRPRHHTRTKSFQHQQQPSKSTTPTPSIASTTSSLSSVKHVFSSWLGNLRAGVSGAWTKARGDTDSFLASQDGESRMQRRRKEIALLTEERKVVKPARDSMREEELDGLANLGGKRPGTSEGLTMPAMKKRSLNTKKLKKQKSEGKLGLGKVSISYPMPSKVAPVATTGSISSVRPPAPPVYRATTGFAEDEDAGLRGKVESLETEISSLRAKLRWFEESYGEIPAETLVDIQHSLTVEANVTKKVRKSAFKEEWGSMTSRNGNTTIATAVADESFLPSEVKALKGFSAKDPIPEESSMDDSTNWIKDSEDTLPQGESVPPEQTIKLIQPSPSIKSVASPPPTRLHSTSPSKSLAGSPTRARLLSASPVKVNAPPSSPIDEYERSVDLLETLSPIHPNIMPALVPRQSGRADLAKENLVDKVMEYSDM